jgi:hypothetical protein
MIMMGPYSEWSEIGWRIIATVPQLFFKARYLVCPSNSGQIAIKWNTYASRIRRINLFIWRKYEYRKENCRRHVKRY